MKVYIVKLDWSTEEGNDIEFTVYDSYEKAYAAFNQLILEEKNPDNSWVGKLDWTNGVLHDKDIDLSFIDRRSDTDETECCWLIEDTWDHAIHTYISIEIEEVL